MTQREHNMECIGKMRAFWESQGRMGFQAKSETVTFHLTNPTQTMTLEVITSNLDDRGFPPI